MSAPVSDFWHETVGAKPSACSDGQPEPALQVAVLVSSLEFRDCVWTRGRQVMWKLSGHQMTLNMSPEQLLKHSSSMDVR